MKWKPFRSPELGWPGRACDVAQQDVEDAMPMIAYRETAPFLLGLREEGLQFLTAIVRLQVTRGRKRDEHRGAPDGVVNRAIEELVADNLPHVPPDRDCVRAAGLPVEIKGEVLMEFGDPPVRFGIAFDRAVVD